MERGREDKKEGGEGGSRERGAVGMMVMDLLVENW